jgi:hypothetical protein
VGDLIRVADRPSTGGTGNEEWVTVSAVTYGAEFATLTFSPALANAYATTNTLVSSIYPTAQIVAACTNITKTSVAGNFDAVTLGNLLAHNKGAVADNWTLTFTGATTFTVAGQTVGALAATGSTAADYAPINPATAPRISRSRHCPGAGPGPPVIRSVSPRNRQRFRSGIDAKFPPAP